MKRGIKVVGVFLLIFVLMFSFSVIAEETEDEADDEEAKWATAAVRAATKKHPEKFSAFYYQGQQPETNRTH